MYSIAHIDSNILFLAVLDYDVKLHTFLEALLKYRAEISSSDLTRNGPICRRLTIR
jgi:hypothetical protein